MTIEDSATSLYLIVFDGEHDYVEAVDFATAIQIWQREMKREQGEDWDATSQPESVTLVHERKAVWR